MSLDTYNMRQRVWLYPGPPTGGGRWHFVSVSKHAGKDIKEYFGQDRRGFGSIPVVVTVGQTSWKTSIFPDKKLGTYVLPIKAEVRKREGITDGTLLAYSIKIRT